MTYLLEPPQAGKHFRFLDLPKEIRLMVRKAFLLRFIFTFDVDL
jgi:hypothetical protein